MTRTSTTPKKKPTAAEDLKRAKKLIATFAELHAEKLAMDKAAREKVSPIVVSMEEARLELLQIGKRNKKAFGKDGNWQFDEGYLHTAYKTEIVTLKGFDMSTFIEEFPDFVETKFKVAPLKKAMLNSETRKPLVKARVDVMQNEDLEVIVK